MSSIFLGGIICDRPALTLRNVMMAGGIILMLTPESLFNPSFQLSFSAVMGLVGGYQAWMKLCKRWAEALPILGYPQILRKESWYILGIVISSTLATLATCPYILYHFQRVPVYGCWTNIIAIPLVSILCLPLLVLFLALLPLGAASLILPFLQISLTILIKVAKIVSAWPGAVFWVPQPSLTAMVLVTFAGFWLCLWRHPWRHTGWGLVILFAASLWFPDIPDLFISGDGKVISYRATPDHVWIHSKSQGKFIRKHWFNHIGVTQGHVWPCHPLRELRPGYRLSVHKDGFSLFYKNQEVLTEQTVCKQGGGFIWLGSFLSDKPRFSFVRSGIGHRPWSEQLPYQWGKRHRPLQPNTFTHKRQKKKSRPSSPLSSLGLF